MSKEPVPRPKDGAETADELLKRLQDENDRLHEEVKRLKQETDNG